jgi:hypothetical protein
MADAQGQAVKANSFHRFPGCKLCGGAGVASYHKERDLVFTYIVNAQCPRCEDQWQREQAQRLSICSR